MKNIIQLFVVVGAVVSFSTAALAKDRAVHHTGIVNSESEAGSSYHSEHTYGLGLTTIGFATTNFSLLFNLSSADQLQGIFGIGGTSPFVFNAGALYKHTCVGNEVTGLHLGLGALFGTASAGGIGTSFAMSFTGLAGFHFALPEVPHLNFSLDGGPTLTIITGTPTVTNFVIGALSPALGLSAHYLF